MLAPRCMGLFVLSILFVHNVYASEPDIGKTALILSKEAYPDINIESYNRRLNDLVDGARFALAGKENPETIIRSLNTYLFETEGFHFDRGNLRNEDPAAFYLSRVLDRKAGVCTGLSVLYLAIADRLELPIFGVNVPGHFFIRYDNALMKRNIEVTQSGKLFPDTYWERKAKISEEAIGNSVYLHSLSRNELLSYLLVNHAAYLAEQPGGSKYIYRSIKEALRLDPRNPTALYMKGWLLVLERQTERALNHFDEAISLDPKYAPALSSRGLVHALAGGGDQALRDCLKACGLKPYNRAYREHLAAVYMARGENHRASRVLRK